MVPGEVNTSEFDFDEKEPKSIGSRTKAVMDALHYSGITSAVLKRRLEQNIANISASIFEECGVRIAVGELGNSELLHPITGVTPNKYELSRGLDLVQAEMRKYPPDLFVTNGVKTIRFLNKIKIGAVDYGLGAADLANETLVIGYDSYDFERFRENSREGFHHELFHIVNYYAQGYQEDDERWRSFHGTDSHAYLEIGGRDAINETLEPSEFFVSEYARRSPMEDRAEVARFLMIPKSHKKLLRLIKNAEPNVQAVLKSKIEDIKNIYFELSQGQMNEKYWQDLLEGRVRQGYFAKRL